MKVNIKNIKDIKLPDESVTCVLNAKILLVLFREKVLSIQEISEITLCDYHAVKVEIGRMVHNGEVLKRNLDSYAVYSLSRLGVNHAIATFDSTTYIDVHDYLIGLGYPDRNVNEFLRSYYYQYYLIGYWNMDSLEEDYIAWCNRQGVEPKTAIMKKEK